MVEINSVTFEHHRENLGIGENAPRISWKFAGLAADWIQSSYEIELHHNRTGIEISEIFHTDTSESILVPWPTEPLKARERVKIRVRAKGGSSNELTPWSGQVAVEVGLLSREDWKASVIAAPITLSTNESLQPVLFRKLFRIEKPVLTARLYISSYGTYQAQINGAVVGDHVLAPGWTSYTHRICYQTFDVTYLLVEGENAIGIEVGEGWYCGRLGFNGGRRYIYGDRLAVLAQLEIRYVNGDLMDIVSDGTWKTSTGPRISSELYDGETYNALLDIPGWSKSAFNDGHWSSVEPLEFPLSKLLAPEGPPVRITQRVKALKAIVSPSGKVIVDFGQNLVGWLRVKVYGPIGHSITFTHVEVLEKGEIATRPLRDCKAKDSLVLSGKPIVWEPKFTFHGFRYVQVDNWPSSNGVPTLTDLEAVVVHTDMERTGWFECSNQMINKLHENICWGMRGNFVCIPTDCPQRDERLGWTGDIQIFSPTANFLFNTSGMLSSWLKDLAIEQIQDLHSVPGVVVPNVLGPGFTTPQAAWSDAAIITPWDLYQFFGDHQILFNQYTSMKVWLSTGIPRQSNGLWDPETDQLGDWLDPAAPPSEPGNGRTDPHLVANAYLVWITHLMAKISKILDQQQDAKYYTSETESLKKEFQREYLTPNGRLAPDTMTSLSLALSFNLFTNPEHRTYAARRLSKLVRASQFRIGTGFVGTPLILPALTTASHSNLAYRMLLETNCPSWMYPITMGATTMWERWDSMLPNGDINEGQMTSFNHYALGSVGAWLHSTVGGISPLEPGWRVVKVEPIPGGELEWAKTSFESPYGRVVCEWRIEDQVSKIDNARKGRDEAKRFVMSLEIPPNCRAEVKLPGNEEVVSVGSGKREFSCAYTADDWPPQALLDPFAQ